MVYAQYRPTHRPFLMNVAYSLLTGFAAVTNFGTLSNSFGLPGWLVAAIGTVLILFAGIILLLVMTGRLNGWWTALISGADLIWVAGTLLALGFLSDHLTRSGRITFAVLAIPVMLLAVAQVMAYLRANG